MKENTDFDKISFDTIKFCIYTVFKELTVPAREQKLTVWRGMRSMKSTGIIRKVDDLGRIVLPIELRRVLDISERDELEIYMENDRIILQKFEPACVFCGSFRNLISFRRKNVCSECVRKMGEY